MSRRAARLRSSITWVLLGLLISAPRPAARQAKPAAAQPSVPAGGQPLPSQVTREFQQKFLQDLQKKANSITGKKAADGSFLDPNGIPISPTVVNGLILTKDTFVADVDSWIRQLEHTYGKLTLEEKRQLVQAWRDSFGKAAGGEIVDKLNEEYSKFVHAAANAKDVHGQLKTTYQNNIKIAEELEKLERERPGTVATRSGLTAAQWRELAANSPYGWFITMRQRFYALLEQNKLLALKKDGQFLFQALKRLDYGTSTQTYINVLNDFLEAGIADAKEQKAKAAAINSIKDLLAFGGPKYAAQQAKAAALGKALGAKLPQLLISETTAVFEGIRIRTEENEEWWNTLKDLGLNVLAAGSILVPFGPIIAAGVAAIQIVRDGSDLVVTYLDEEEARKAAPVNGYRYVITAEDRTAAAQDKFFITALTSSADLLGFAAIKDIKFLKGGKAASGVAGDVAKTAAVVGNAANAVETGNKVVRTITERVENGLAYARKLGVPEAEIQKVIKAIDTLPGDGKAMVQKAVLQFDEIQQLAKELNIPDEQIRAAMLTHDELSIENLVGTGSKSDSGASAAGAASTTTTTSSVTGKSSVVATDLFVRAAEKKGVIFMVSPTSKSKFDQLFAHANFKPTAVVGDPAALQGLATKLEFVRNGRLGAWTQEEIATLNALAKHPEAANIYAYFPDENAFYKIFSPDDLKLAKTINESPAKQAILNGQLLPGQDLPVLPKTGVTEPPRYGAGSGAPTTGTLTVDPTSGNAVKPAGPKATADAAASAAGRGPYGPLDLKGITPDGVAQLTTEELSRITKAQFDALPDGPMKQAIAQQIVKRVTAANEARAAALNLLKRDGLNVAAATMATAGGLKGLEKLEGSTEPAGGKTIAQAANAAFTKQFGPNVPTETIENADGSVTVKSKDGKKVVTTKKGKDEISGADEYVSDAYAEPEPEVKEVEPPNDTFRQADLDLRKYIEEKLKGDPDEWVPVYDEAKGTITYTNTKNGSKVTGRVQPDGGVSNIRTSMAPDGPVRPGDFTAMDGWVREELRKGGINTDGWTYKPTNPQATEFTYTSPDGKTSVDAKYDNGRMIVGQPYATPGAAANNVVPAAESMKPAPAPAPTPNPTPATPATPAGAKPGKNPIAKDLCNSAANWRADAAKSEQYAREATNSTTRQQFLDRAQWEKNQADMYERWAKDYGQPCDEPASNTAVGVGGLGDFFNPDAMPGFFNFAPGLMNNISPMLGGLPPMPSVQNIIITTDGAAVEIEITDFAARYAAPPGGPVMAALAPGALVTLAEPAQAGGRPTLSIVATGASTGEVFKVHVANAKGQPMHVVAPDGLVLEAVTTKPVTAGPGAAGIEGYCLDFMKPPPPASTQYRVASEATQKKFAPVRNILRASAKAARDGLLHPDSDPRSYAQFIKQYSLWTHLERWNIQSFGEAFVDRTKKNFQALKRGWTKEVEQAVRAAIPGRWRDIQTVLQQVNAVASAAGGK
jgi:hypothetical protein